MKNKTVIILLSVLAVLIYTTAVINFCLGNVLSGIGNVLMACALVLMAFSLYHEGQLGRMANKMREALIGMLVQFAKGTITLGHDDDEAPEEELTEQEKRVKRMAEEYDELRGRYERLTDFVVSDTYKQLPENKRTLLSRQHQAMHDYLDVLTQRLRIEAKETNLQIDIEEPDTETAE